MVACIVFMMDLLLFCYKKSSRMVSVEEKDLLEQYNRQVYVVKRLNSVETFVEQSKATRRMNAIKAELDKFDERRQQTASGNVYVRKLQQFQMPIMSCVCLGVYWDVPLVRLEPGFLIPFERFLAIPGFSVGTISAIGWLSVCRRVSTKVFGT
uniref:Uncharacterized protein AlNc14C297G10329 n=1 Tax=Albugo laibachii Nc14 TaxID=890382 RepID=F0WVJ4_9STRA|nr:conserved hypothetical protein [Albugo laibachii Nc14]|eukprot:CCA25436.1 conserved hypothetical protein [Albugo laibachii Nc14]